MRILLVVACLMFSSFSYGNNSVSILSNNISIVKNQLLAPSGQKYQWYKNDIAIENGKCQNLNVAESGNYTVEYIDEGGDFKSEKVSIAVTAAGIIKIYLIGDSTVCNYAASAYPFTGWGQVLPYFFNSANVAIDNRAIGGRSSRSFYKQGRWTTVSNLLAAGDYVFIQFGHNDRDFSDTSRYTNITDYKAYLTIYVNETRAKGAFPVLVSPMVLNAWTGTTMRNVFTETGNNYRGAMLEVATALNVPFIDLNMKSWNLYKGLGKDYITRFIYHNYVAGEYPNYPNGVADGTHFQEMGAIENARMIVQGISELSTNAKINGLIPYLMPTYQVAVSANVANSGLITRTNTYPAGVNVTVKTIPNAGFTFMNWNNSSSQSVTTEQKYIFKMTAAVTKYTAIFKTTGCKASIANTPTSFCKGENITLTGSGGTSYRWFSGNTVVGTSVNLQVTTAGTYCVEINDGKGCLDTSNTINITTTTPSTWYADTDADGKGDASVTKLACVQPQGYVSIAGDACPTDAAKTVAGNCGCGKTETSCLDCFGVANGKALTDNCGRCVAGTTTQIACTGSLEAENACSFEGTVDNNNLGFLGTGFINTPNVIGTKVEFNINTSAAGIQSLGVRYALGGTVARGANVILNGVNVGTMVFAPTGAFTAYGTESINLNLASGKNTLQLVSTTTAGLANIDLFYWVNKVVSAGTCIVTSVEQSDLNSGLTVIPQPFNSFATIALENSDEIQSYTIYDVNGKAVQTETLNNVTQIQIGEGLNSGLYFVVVTSLNRSYSTKILKLKDL